MALSNRNSNRSLLHAELIVQLRSFSAGTVFFNQVVADRFGLHLTDLQCMNLLEMLGTATPGKLAEWMGLTTGGVTVMLDRLEKSGCIRRERNPVDRRSVLVRVSASKMKKIDVHYVGLAEGLDAYILTLSQPELESAVSLLQNLNGIRLKSAAAEGKRCKRS